MQEDPDTTINAHAMEDLRRRVEAGERPEMDDPDMVAADDGGVSALAQKLAFKRLEKGRAG